MGADENVAIMQRAYDAFNAADIDTLTDLFDENVVWHLPGQSSMAKDYEGGGEIALRVADIGRRFDEPDLVALALNLQGRALIYQGQVSAGLSALDEAMVAVVGGEVTAPAAGAVYCSVIEARVVTSPYTSARTR